MDEKFISNSRYEYTQEIEEWRPEVVDFHRVRVLRRSGFAKTIVRCISIVIVIVFVASVLSISALISVKDDLASFVLVCFLMGVVFPRSLLGKQADKESVVILPAFGVQLETHYISGGVIRHFIPIDKILKPVLNECLLLEPCVDFAWGGQTGANFQGLMDGL